MIKVKCKRSKFDIMLIEAANINKYIISMLILSSHYTALKFLVDNFVDSFPDRDPDIFLPESASF